MNRIPILYNAIVRAPDGHEGSVNLEEPGWRDREDFKNAMAFSLQPKAGSGLPVVCVELLPLPDGTPKRLVYFSRVYGRVVTSGEPGTVSTAEEQVDLFRLYCIGWEAEVAGRPLKAVSWIYPGGSLMMCENPPFIDELVEHFATELLFEQGKLTRPAPPEVVPERAVTVGAHLASEAEAT